jgi:SAM-dependent methyltransferase
MKPLSSVQNTAGPSIDSARASSPATASEWNDFAKRDAYAYIMTDLPAGDREAFWKSGARTVSEQLVPVVRDNRVSPGIALEVGCGVGRLTLPMAGYFQTIVGVDISIEMVRQANAIAAERRAANVQFITLSDYDSCEANRARLDGKVDFVYSLLVFQHIDDFSLIDSHLRRISNLLCTDGIAYLQFDTRRHTLAYRLKNVVPDPALPRFLRRGIRRIRRTPGEIELSFAQNHLRIVNNIRPFSENHCYTLRKSDT